MMWPICSTAFVRICLHCSDVIYPCQRDWFTEFSLFKTTEYIVKTFDKIIQTIVLWLKSTYYINSVVLLIWVILFLYENWFIRSLILTLKKWLLEQHFGIILAGGIQESANEKTLNSRLLLYIFWCFEVLSTVC